MKKEKKHNKQKVCYICKKGFSTDDNNKKYHKVKDHCHYNEKYRGAAHDICNLRYTEGFEGEFECLGENTEKHTTFSLPIKKETIKIDKYGNDEIVDISYKIKFTDSIRFMSS